ncbi:MAG: outer membrane beta-barrel protein [Bacteroidales bacterium]|nr:outer membrane beta-barrel protein [Bacteroidales bacterium]MBQ2491966.1 outer membrane beta-barrel protein [Bacteroidales bacterium]MBQ4197493.1 outer membrane beta-barrel protein [Bacteroidales bacterium]
MKKLFLTISVLLFAFVAASAQGNMNQPGFHDLSVSAGYGSSMQFIDNYTKIISDYPSYEAKDFKFFPTVSAEYGYRVSERFAVGAVLSFQVADSHILNEGRDNTKARDTWYSLMPQARFFWYTNKNMNVYSKAAVGLTARRNKYTNNNDIIEKFRDFNIAWQVSAIGFEYGNIVCGFAEAGFGTQGFIQAGVRIKFAF